MDRNKVCIIIIIVIWSIDYVIIQVDTIDIFIIDIVFSIVRGPNCTLIYKIT